MHIRRRGKEKSHKSSGFIHYLMIIVLALTISSVVFLPSSVSGRPLYAEDLPSSLKNYCQVCHTSASGGPLNKFGRDYHMFNFNMSRISTLDSDGDGFTNSEELAEGTFPGDPNSYPGGPQETPMMKLILTIAGSLLLFILVRIYITKTKRRMPQDNF